jgi:capsid portal protein
MSNKKEETVFKGMTLGKTGSSSLESNQILNLSKKMVRSGISTLSEKDKKSKSAPVVTDTGLVEMNKRRKDMLEANSPKEEKDPNKDYRPDDYYIPPYDPAVWVYLPEFSSKIYKSIDILKNNIVTNGWEVVPYKHERNLSKKELKKFEQEKIALEEFFLYPNSIGESSTEIFIKFFLTREYSGAGALKFGEDIFGNYESMEFYPAYQLKIRKDGQGFLAGEDTFFGSGKEYFKYFGDRRIMDKKTGRFGTDDKSDKKNFVPLEKRAASIFWLPVYTPASQVTGMPRYAPARNSLVGNFLSSKLNIDFFVRGLLVRVMIVVNNGRLDEETTKQLEEWFDHSKGVENAKSGMLLQMEKKSIVSSELLGDENSKPKIEIHELIKGNREDSTFQEYRKENDKEQQNIYAIPDLFFGDARDITRASANVVRKLTQSQTFDPIAQEIENPMNSKLIPEILSHINSIKINVKAGLDKELESEKNLPKDWKLKLNAKEKLEFLKVKMRKKGYRYKGIENFRRYPSEGEPDKNTNLVFEQRSVARFKFVRTDLLDPMELSEIIRNTTSVGVWTPNSVIENVLRRLFPDVETFSEEWANIPMNMLIMLINSKLPPFEDPNNRERMDLEWARLGISRDEGEEIAEEERENAGKDEQPAEVKRVLSEYGVGSIEEYNKNNPDVMLDCLFSLRGMVDELSNK